MAGLGSLFAPAYQAGNQQSTDAVDQWMATNFGMTNPKVEATRRPAAFNTGNPAGMVDPEALRVLAQGGPYNPSTRDEIAAAQIAANPALAPAAPTAATAQPGGAGSGGYNPFSSNPVDPRGGLVAYGTPEYAALEQRWAAELAANGPRVQQPVYQDSFGGGPA